MCSSGFGKNGPAKTLHSGEVGNASAHDRTAFADQRTAGASPRARPADANGEKVGVWMIGACGAVGSTVALGIASLHKRLIATTGLVTELPPFQDVELVDPGSIVVGGHEVRTNTFRDTLAELHTRSDLFRPSVIHECASHLDRMQANIKAGTLCGSDATNEKLADRSGLTVERCPAEAVERLTADIIDFRRNHQLDRVVVVNVASSEPRPQEQAAHAQFAKLQEALAKPASTVLPPSSIYALAAIEARCPYVNFTPSFGVNPPAIQERAKQLGVPFMGNDGKTGETLLKSVIAPMFAMRNLSVLSWIGHNILGNRDGAALQDPQIRASKLRAKNKAISQVVNDSTTTHVSIEYAPSLDDRKVAWDFIHFEGFLGTKMSLQFTWQGCDSALAAPLIIDLVRLAAVYDQSGCGGAMRHLSCFFKDPIGVEDPSLFAQWEMLVNHVQSDVRAPAVEPA